jgi:lysine 2,3-aminomutase
MEALRGHTSGYAVPTYVIDAPEGGGKIPLAPNYLLSMSESRIVVRNYEGYISAYSQPAEYMPHNRATCHYCQTQRQEGDQKGIAAICSRDEKKGVSCKRAAGAESQKVIGSVKRWCSKRCGS